MALTFRGGIFIPEHKNTKDNNIRDLKSPKQVTVALPDGYIPSVKKGDRVDIGQLIGNSSEDTCPVYASVSGTVSDINGTEVQNIIIANDGEDRISKDVVPYIGTFADMTFDDVVEVVRNAGICGTDGDGLPVYEKLLAAKDKVDTIIINCIDSEPNLTSNTRLIVEETDAVIGGMKILLKALGLRTADIAVEDNKPDVIKLVRNKIKGGGYADLRVLKAKYPQAEYGRLVYAIADREIPEGKRSFDVGCVVFDAETCVLVYRAFVYGEPMIRRVVTVDGDGVSAPGCVSCPIGTAYSELIEFCGGNVDNVKYIVDGGPITGQPLNLNEGDAFVSDGTKAIFAFSKEEKRQQHAKCIRCGRCVSVCPAFLMPNYLCSFAQREKYDRCEKYGVMSCTECGACSYICPGHMPIVELNRAAKRHIKSKEGGVSDEE